MIEREMIGLARVRPSKGLAVWLRCDDKKVPCPLRVWLLVSFVYLAWRGWPEA